MNAGISARTPQQALAALLDLHQPKRLLLLGASQFPALDAFKQAHPDTRVSVAAPGPLPAELAAQRFDLALVVDCLEHLSKPQGLTLLGGIRNLNASRIAVLVDLGACDWKDTDFFSLALQAGERFQRDEQVLTLFTYDLLDYKQVPDWLNARFWANPEILESIGGNSMSTSICPCGSGNLLDACCGHYHAGHPAPCASALMRSRYSAYVLGLVDYLVATTLPAQQAGLDRNAMAAWSAQSTWLGLEVENSEVFGGQPEHAFVTFTARWHDSAGEHSHRERSSFVQNGERWYFIDPTVEVKAGRNDACLCGSGRKFKKCCSSYF